MPRVINKLDRISDDFEQVSPESRADLVAELFTRLDESQAADAVRLMTFWRNRQLRESKRSQIPPLMDRDEVEAAGKLALSPVPEVKQ